MNLMVIGAMKTVPCNDQSKENHHPTLQALNSFSRIFDLIVLVLLHIYSIVHSHQSHQLCYQTYFKSCYCLGNSLLNFLALLRKIFLFPYNPFFFYHTCVHESQEFKNSYFPPALHTYSMRPWIIQIVFTVHHALPCPDCLRDCVTKPGCCMDEGVLFMGDATLKKIFCLQDTLRGVGGRPPLTESLLQPERVLFLPSPLLREKTSASQRSGKQVRYHLTPPLFQLLIQTQAHIRSSVQEGLRPRLTSPLRKKSRKPYKSFKSTSSLEKWSR